MGLREPDRLVLEQLAAEGNDPNIPRAVVHYFYADRREPLDVMAYELEDVGWTNIELGKGSDHFRLLATKVCDLRDDTVEKMMSEVDQAIADRAVDYDGWETTVEKNN